MAVLLGLLFILAIAGLGFVGYHAFRLHTTVTRLETELAAQRARYEQDSKQWHDHGEKIKAQYQGVVNKYNEDCETLERVFHHLEDRERAAVQVEERRKCRGQGH